MERKKVIAFYPGRFQFPHRGHREVYERLLQDADEVYITTSNKVEYPNSPFNFLEKQFLLTQLGIPKDNIIELANPNNIESLADKIHANEDVTFVLALGEKDAERFAHVKSNDESYFKYLEDTNKELESSHSRAYIMIMSDFKFMVNGALCSCASDLRHKYKELTNDNEREDFVEDAFWYATNTSKIKDILDIKLCNTTQQST